MSFDVRRPGNGAVFQSNLLTSQSVGGIDPLLEDVVDDTLNDAHPERVELEERQSAVEEGRVGSRFLQVESDDDFVVVPETGALLRRTLYSEYCLCTIRERGTGSVIQGLAGQNLC